MVRFLSKIKKINNIKFQKRAVTQIYNINRIRFSVDGYITYAVNSVTPRRHVNITACTL